MRLRDFAVYFSLSMLALTSGECRAQSTPTRTITDDYPDFSQIQKRIHEYDSKKKSGRALTRAELHQQKQDSLRLQAIRADLEQRNKFLDESKAYWSGVIKRQEEQLQREVAISKTLENEKTLLTREASTLETDLAGVPALKERYVKMKAEIAEGAIVCREKQDHFAWARKLKDQIGKITGRIVKNPLKIHAPKVGGLVIDVTPDLSMPNPKSATQTQAKDYWQFHTGKAGNALISWKKRTLVRDPNHRSIQVNDLSGMNEYLKSLPDGSVSSIRIHSHMGPAGVWKFGMSYGDQSNPEIQRKFKKGASIQLVGCEFAKDDRGWAGMQFFADTYLAKNGGTVAAFEQVSWSSLDASTRVDDIFSKGNRMEYKVSPGKKPELIRIKSSYVKPK